MNFIMQNNQDVYILVQGLVEELQREKYELLAKRLYTATFEAVWTTRHELFEELIQILESEEFVGSFFSTKIDEMIQKILVLVKSEIS